MSKLKITAICLVLLFMSITPISADQIGTNQDLENMNKWMEGSDWYKILYMGQFTSSASHLIEQTEKIEQKQQEKSRMLPEGDYWMRQHLARAQETLHTNHIYTTTYEGDPIPGVIVQLKWKDSPKPEYREHTLHYWYLAGYVEENGQIKAIVNDGEKEFKITKDELNQRYTNYALKLDDPQSSPAALGYVKQMQQQDLDKDTSEVNTTYYITVTLLVIGLILLVIGGLGTYVNGKHAYTTNKAHDAGMEERRKIEVRNSGKIAQGNELRKEQAEKEYSLNMDRELKLKINQDQHNKELAEIGKLREDSAAIRKQRDNARAKLNSEWEEIEKWKTSPDMLAVMNTKGMAAYNAQVIPKQREWLKKDDELTALNDKLMHSGVRKENFEGQEGALRASFEERNKAIEEEISDKLDDSRVALERGLRSLRLENKYSVDVPFKVSYKSTIIFAILAIIGLALTIVCGIMAATAGENKNLLETLPT